MILMTSTFYERPDGEIVYPFRWVGRGKSAKLLYHISNDIETFMATVEEGKTWKERRDLFDFPNAEDAKLPFVFEVFWDITRMSELKEALGEDSEFDKEEKRNMRRFASDYGLVIL